MTDVEIIKYLLDKNKISIDENNDIYINGEKSTWRELNKLVQSFRKKIK